MLKITFHATKFWNHLNLLKQEQIQDQIIMNILVTSFSRLDDFLQQITKIKV